MNLISLRQKTGRLALATASTGFIVGLAFLNNGSAHAIGGLCNGRPASHTWLDASGQYGPALIEGTNDDDTIVGDGGNDTVSGGTGNDFLVGGSGDDVMISSDDDSVDKVNGGDDFDDCLFGAGDEVNNCEY